MADCGQFRTLKAYTDSVVNPVEANRYFLNDKLADLESRVRSFENRLVAKDLVNAGSLMITVEERDYIFKTMLPSVTKLLGEEGRSKLLCLSTKYRVAVEVMQKMARREISGPPSDFLFVNRDHG